MTMTTFMPFDVDKFLDEALRGANGNASRSPACNAYEDERSYWVQAALPGLHREDIEIVVEDQVLTIKGERKEEASKDKTYFVREFNRGSFVRSFKLPTTADHTKVAATYQDGVLTVELPKREETKPRRITIA
ncbi:MAG TPA: Hsp20/alpha crystallin family protein [Nitrospiraceae bacterium]|jgi:HSP20 family protein|nr:Hsp20/alpha crystallin family protein [Nitrospiraceae bacterium]